MFAGEPGGRRKVRFGIVVVALGADGRPGQTR